MEIQIKGGRGKGRNPQKLKNPLLITFELGE